MIPTTHGIWYRQGQPLIVFRADGRLVVLAGTTDDGNPVVVPVESLDGWDDRTLAPVLVPNEPGRWKREWVIVEVRESGDILWWENPAKGFELVVDDGKWKGRA